MTELENEGPPTSSTVASYRLLTSLEDKNVLKGLLIEMMDIVHSPVKETARINK